LRGRGVLLGHTSEQIVGHRNYQLGDRLRWQSEYDELVNRIRRLPGFARFLLPAEPAGPRSAADGGVVVLVDRRRDDAVIINADGDPVVVPLPDLSWRVAGGTARHERATNHRGGQPMRERPAEHLDRGWPGIGRKGSKQAGR
jgi:hypothetical protein